MASCKMIPIRIWIILLIFLNRYLMMWIKQNLKFCWRFIVERKNFTRYKPWCILTTEERDKNQAQQIPWYHVTSPDYGPRFKWDQQQKELFGAALFYGQTIAAVPGGILAELFGPYYMLLYTTLITAIFNGLTGLFAAIDWKLLMASEFLIGIHIGLAFPALYVWIARWAPPNERGIFVASFVGLGFAAAFGRIFIRIMTPFIGWRGIFYTGTLLTLLYLVALFFLGCNHPEDHKRITAKELYYIKKSQRGKVTSTRSFPPFGRILSSRAFWVLNILHYGTSCADRYFLEVIENFLFHYMGIAKSLVEYLEVFPYIGCCALTLAAAILGDFIRIKNMIDDSNIIKLYVIFSHLIPGCILLFMGVTHCNQHIAVVLLFVGYASSGCSAISCYRTIIDISPNFAGTMYGLMHVSASSLKIIIPKLQTYIFSINDGIIGWTLIFLIGGGCVVGTGLIFVFFALGNCQWWNLKPQDRFKVFSYKKPEDTQTGEALTEPSVSKKSSIK